MPTSARWEVANSPQISVKTGVFCRADVGIGPYADLEDRYKNVWPAGTRALYSIGYVTPHTVMDASSSRSMICENSQVRLTSLSSQLPAPESLMEP